MNKKQKIIVSVVGITIVLLALLGLTYAYFLTRIQGNTNEKSISVTTADLKLVYGDGNGLIEANSIMPGTTLTTKKFTVKNEGNAKVDNYVVYLEELVNELTRVDDLVYTLTCTSDRENKTCKGVNETSFPKLAGMIVTNSIDVGETQSYELTITYKEMNVDQSDDMNKKISARVQIYNLQDIVDITGTVTNANEGDYIELHSDPKKSRIVNNKYIIAAVEPGTHTLYVKDKEGNVRGSKEITIKKGNTASVDGTNIIVTNDSQTVYVDIEAIDTALTVDIGVPKDYSPFEEGTLANAIYMNAKTNVNGTTFSATPLTIPAQSVSYKYYTDQVNEATTETSTSISTKYQGYYWTYGTGYTIDENSGEFTLTGVATCKYNDGTCNETLVGKYLVQSYASGNSSSTNTQTTTTNLSSIYKVTIAPASSTSSITMKAKRVSAVSYSSEATLSATIDDYGTSYYYRGSVKNNYIEFNNMCWRIVRIEGDGSIKIILAKEGLCSTITSSDRTSALINKAVYGYKIINSNRYADYKNNSGGLYTTLKAWYKSSGLENKKSLLKNEKWCLGGSDNYRYNSSTGVLLTDAEVTEIENNDGKYYYYAAGKRLYGIGVEKNATLKCSSEEDNVNDYIGTLTVDEIVYAGGKAGYSNKFYYLYDNAQSYYWSLSRSDFVRSLDGDRAFAVDSGGRLNSYDVDLVYDAYNVGTRPTVTLATGAQIASGDGTISNPYKILES